jgi:lathosterol oxidase
VLEVLEWVRGRPPLDAALWSLSANVGVFAMTLLFGAAVLRWLRGVPVSAPPEPLTIRELVLAAACVTLNGLVMWVGWLLFRAGWLQVGVASSPARIAADALALLLAMDLGMYLTHRVAHHPVIFRLVHSVHHRYERVRPLTLFTLHPVEVLGFGGLWIALLLAHAFSLGGILLYLTLNTTFGVVGHLGIEPVPGWIRRLPLVRRIGTSTFHARHHQATNTNFGFYTSLWDALFGTLDVRDTAVIPPR